MLENEERYINEMTGDKDKIQLTLEQKDVILKKQNRRCRHCRKKVSWKKDNLVVDHSHYSGEIHGISHNEWYSSF